MTVTQILYEIRSAGVENEILQLLVQSRIDTLEQKSKALAEAKATLRLISKVTKDKTVQTILTEDEEE